MKLDTVNNRTHRAMAEVAAFVMEAVPVVCVLTMLVVAMLRACGR